MLCETVTINREKKSNFFCFCFAVMAEIQATGGFLVKKTTNAHTLLQEKSLVKHKQSAAKHQSSTWKPAAFPRTSVYFCTHSH